MRRRANVYNTGNTGGGGGPPPTIGNVDWGPDFGEDAGSDGITAEVGAQVELTALALAGGADVGATVDLDALALEGGADVGAQVGIAELGLEGGADVGAALDAEATLTIKAPQDSWVGRPGQLLSPAGNNDGTQLQLHGLVTAERDIYIKFPTASINPSGSANVTAATLRCFQVTPLLLDLAAVTTHPLAQGDEGWDETTLSKANAPTPQASNQSWTQGTAAEDKALTLNATWLSHLESRIDAGVDTTIVLQTGVLGVLLRSYQSADANIQPIEDVVDGLSPATYLRLGEDSGSFTDTGSNALTVTEVDTVIRNSTGLVTSEAGDDGGIEVDSGAANYVHVGDNYDFAGNGSFSVVAFFRMDAATGDRGVVFKASEAVPQTGAGEGGWSLYFSATSGSFVFAESDTLTVNQATGQTTDVGAGVIYCVGAVWDSPGGSPITNPRTMRVYLNGVEDGSQTSTRNPFDTGFDCRTADIAGDEVDEVAIFDYALSADEMASIADAGFNVGDDNGPRLELTLDLP